MYKQIIKRDDLLVYYHQLTNKEELFFNNLMIFITKYPLLWYNFVENVLKNDVILICEYNSLIISNLCLTKSLRKILNSIIKIMSDSLVINKIIENNDFLIIYLTSKAIADFFHNSGFWLEYLTSYAIKNIIGEDCFRGVLIKNNNKLQEVDCIFNYNDFMFLIECKDTSMYNSYDLQKLSNLRKIFGEDSHCVLITSKQNKLPQYEFLKYNIDCVYYKYNYWLFKDDLENYIISKII